MSEQTVYLVDDNAAFRRSTAWLLKTAGFAVTDFCSGREALDALKNQPPSAEPSCLVSDVRMPGMNGLHLHEELKRCAIDIPVVFVTGHGDVPLAVEAMRKGAVDFIEKPFEEGSIVEAVRGAMAKRERNRDAASGEQKLACLTRRERQVMDLVVASNPNKVIAGMLDISIKTVELHRANMMTKLGVRSLPDLMKLVLGHRN